MRISRAYLWGSRRLSETRKQQFERYLGYTWRGLTLILGSEGAGTCKRFLGEQKCRRCHFSCHLSSNRPHAVGASSYDLHLPSECHLPGPALPLWTCPNRCPSEAAPTLLHTGGEPGQDPTSSRVTPTLGRRGSSPYSPAQPEQLQPADRPALSTSMPAAVGARPQLGGTCSPHRRHPWSAWVW